MVEFGKKIGQGMAKSGQYLHPIYITSVWVHSVHVLYMNIGITTTKIIEKDKEKNVKNGLNMASFEHYDAETLRT